MKTIGTLLLLLILPLLSWAQNPNLLENISFEDEIADTWTLVTNNGAVATTTIIEEKPAWVTTPIHRMQIDITQTSADKDIYSVYLTNGSVIPLNTGDSLFLSYYFRSTPGETQLQPILYRTDAPEGEESIIAFDPLTVAAAFGGMKKTSAKASVRGNYELRMCIGANVASYITDNYVLESYDYQSDGAPVISSFDVKMEQQGDQGVNQIIGRAVATDLENDDFTLEFSIISGGGVITSIDSVTFMYKEDGPGEKVFKVIASDSNGNVRSTTTSYTVSDFNISDLYFVEDVWALVRAENGYTNHASFTFPTNNPDLPNVLLMGNSISIGYTPYVRTALAGKANVYRIPDNGGSTLDMFENQALWLGDTHWDVIHFNWGLHDLKYLLNNSLNLNGTQVVPVDEFGVNMDSIVRILQPEADHLIFATISHIPSKAAGRKAGDEVIYNQSALNVMANYPEIIIDDQYTLTNTYSSEHNNDGDVHFNNAGKQRQANQAAAAILAAIEGTTTINTVHYNTTDTPYYYSAQEQILTQKLDQGIEKLVIYTINGQIVKSINNPASMISLTEIPQGMHIICAESKQTIYTQKIAIQ